jgi:hypothetical protein
MAHNGDEVKAVKGELEARSQNGKWKVESGEWEDVELGMAIGRELGNGYDR